jgi:DNA-binding GntR family transcriptional regulator
MPAQEAITEFICATFRSVWSLELLCHLRAQADRALSVPAMVAELRASDLIVRQSVDTLVAAGLLIVDEQGGAQYHPVSEELDQLVDAACALYAKTPDAVRRMIVAGSHPGITAFADAFRLRRD